MTAQPPSTEHRSRPLAESGDVATDRQHPRLAEIRDTLAAEAPVFTRLLGVPGVQIRFDDNTASGATVPGMQWQADAHTLLISPVAFADERFTDEEIVYAMLIETVLRVREPLIEPELSREADRFRSRGDAERIFIDVFASVTASRRLHALLPKWSRIGASLTGTRLYPERRFTPQLPRHLQFMYALAREQLVPGAVAPVADDVKSMLAEFQDFQGTGQDLLSYSTQPFTSATEIMSGSERFAIWTRNIYPRWQELLERDLAEQTRGAAEHSRAPRDRRAPQGPRPAQSFSQFYEEFHDEVQPHRAERNALRKTLSESAQQHFNPGLHTDARLKTETGHGSGELQRYEFETHRFREQVDHIRALYRDLLGRSLHTKRTLKPGYIEGAVLSPERLAQTAFDIRVGLPDPPAFSDYARSLRPQPRSGGADIVFVFDCSGSMLGAKSAAAASTAVMCLEAFACMLHEIEHLTQTLGMTHDADIRCAVYTFNDHVNNPKPLSGSLTLKERLDTLADVRSPGGGNADTHMLQTMIALPHLPERTRTLIVVADGEADDSALARERVLILRRRGWRVVGLSIGSDAAVQLYAPHARRVNDPAELPLAMQQVIEESL